MRRRRRKQFKSESRPSKKIKVNAGGLVGVSRDEKNPRSKKVLQSKKEKSKRKYLRHKKPLEG